MGYETIRKEIKGEVGIITLDRPKALNALNAQLIEELLDAVVALDQDSKIGCIVITGSEKAFAAGADIKEMQSRGFPDVYLDDLFAKTERLAACRKPVIAAVAGYALGGGCELAMMCDFIIAAENAKFGQPEINLGVIPGIGGTQRLTRAIGKAKSMDMCLTGRMMDVKEAESAGLVSRIVPIADLMDEVMTAAAKIADQSLTTNMMLKEAVNQSFETTLAAGLLFERRNFHSLFATQDQSEGMQAFIEKRAAQFKNK
ncbi:MAG: enoyl-CoA hydratase [Hyphomicrobiales bacterium]